MATTTGISKNYMAVFIWNGSVQCSSSGSLEGAMKCVEPEIQDTVMLKMPEKNVSSRECHWGNLQTFYIAWPRKKITGYDQ